MLDEVQTLAQLEAFDPERFLQLELAPVATPSELGAVLDELRRLLDAVDRFAQKAMAIRLNLLGADPIPREFRLLLKTTVIKYHGQVELLRGRVMAAMARVDQQQAAEVTGRVMDAAERVLELHGRLRGGLLQKAAAVAAAEAPAAEKRGRDRTLPERGEWRKAAIDLRQIAADPRHLETASFAERMKKIPTPEEEPETESQEEKRFSLIEID
jgi:hypothetical protein